MSPFDTLKESSMIPTPVSDQNGPIPVGFPNEAIIADWPHRPLAGDTGEPGSEPAIALDDYPNDTELLVSAAADTRW